MSNEPQRDIEKELLAYKQRRREQAGAPLELHPATRRMLQGELARNASRPLLSSEEAAKNFVRSFVMSHQQPGFFTRHKPRLIWGGAMFACLALVLAVLRNDPRKEEQALAFSDALPAPPAAPALPSPAALARAAGQPPGTDNDRFAVDRKSLAVQSAAAPRSIAPTPPASTPLVPREAELRRFAVAKPAPAPVTAPTAPPLVPSTMERSRALGDRSMEREVATPVDKLAAGPSAEVASAPLAKNLLSPAAPSGAFLAPSAKLAEAAKAAPGDAFARGQTPTILTLAGTTARAAVALTDAQAKASESAVKLQFSAAGNAAPAFRQQFQQLDDRAGYRQNFNSPPVPQVMQDFAFERIGDRVRIVDGDGSTYEGRVLSETAEATRLKAVADAEGQRERRDLAQLKQATGAAGETYFFIASGRNQKLNQSVEFRGQWQATAPSPTNAVPALLITSSDLGRQEVQTAMKKEKALAPREAIPQGRISGRAVVGGKNEFDINAVPR